MIIDKKGWYFRGGRGWYFREDEPLPYVSKTPSTTGNAPFKQTEEPVVQPHPRLQERIETVEANKQKRRRFRMLGLGLALVTADILVGTGVRVELKSDANSSEPQQKDPYYPCEFSEELKWEKLELGEGLGSLAVRTVKGVDWGVCDDKAALWIRAHNPRLVNGHDSRVIVPESVNVRG